MPFFLMLVRIKLLSCVYAEKRNYYEYRLSLIHIYIATAIGTGKNGDGKVFVTEVLDAMRIRTNERGDDALM